MAGKKKKEQSVEEPKPHGRPEFKPDYDVVESALGLQLNQAEIAHVLGCTPKTLAAAVKRDFDLDWAEFVTGKTGNVKYTIRRKLYQEALAGNTRALLKMDDKLFPPEQRVAGPGGGPLQTDSNSKFDLSGATMDELLVLQKVFKENMPKEEDE